MRRRLGVGGGLTPGWEAETLEKKEGACLVSDWIMTAR